MVAETVTVLVLVIERVGARCTTGGTAMDTVGDCRADLDAVSLPATILVKSIRTPASSVNRIIVGRVAALTIYSPFTDS